MTLPSSTYRLQLSLDFTFTDAADVAPYLAALGISHLYVSPILQAAAGSTHGYDVIDHQQLNTELGGAAGFALLIAACTSNDLGLIVDIVPNHMYVGAPEQGNTAWYDVLRHGQASPFARWFDIDWAAPGLEGTVLVPILDDDLAAHIDRGELTLDGDVLRFRDHVLPVNDADGAPLTVDLLERQHYRLTHWREGRTRLNYRRFFDITTLAGVRVEDPTVSAATHRVLTRLCRDGVISGLRIDHPDGLADPSGYLTALGQTTNDTWVVVEKVCETGESLPADWRCAGTTGYDALNAVLGLFVDSTAEQRLTDIYAAFTGAETDWSVVAEAAKRDAVRTALLPELARLARVAVTATDADYDAVAEALGELLVALAVYRVYVDPRAPASGAARMLIGETVETAARSSAQPDLVRALGDLVLDGPAELVTRFQQTSGPVLAKGVEDTAFYRYARFVALNEVGGDPGRFGRPPAEFHQFAARVAATWPSTMTALSTHDTKRAEDVRARLAVLSEIPDEWADAVTRWAKGAAGHRTGPAPDPVTEYLLWQTIVGAWPISASRAAQYAEKATREAKVHTAWVDGDPDFDAAVRRFVDGVLGDRQLVEDISAFVDRVGPAARSNSLAQKLVQLTMPGVPDVYQGTELRDLSLVDPDNRRPVDFEVRRARLEDGADEKLNLVRAALQARRRRPDCYGPEATYTPVAATGVRADHAVAFLRGDAAVTVATRLPERLRVAGGWGETSAIIPAGVWTDLLSGMNLTTSGQVALTDVLAGAPVALLIRA